MTGALAALALVELAMLVQIVEAPGGWRMWMDYVYYRDLGAAWLADGSYYLPRQLAGPYDLLLMADVLYPPTALLLFVPLVFLPAPAWWLIPAGIVGYAVWRWHPTMWTWPVLLLLLMWPKSMSVYVYGNTDMWVTAGVAGGLLWGWPALLILLKPTFAPLAFIGVRRRSWWVVAIAVGAVSIAMLPLWFDYLTAMTNVRKLGWDYSLMSFPLLLVPVVAWLGATHGGSRAGLSWSLPARRTAAGTAPHRGAP